MKLIIGSILSFIVGYLLGDSDIEISSILMLAVLFFPQIFACFSLYKLVSKSTLNDGILIISYIISIFYMLYVFGGGLPALFLWSWILSIFFVADFACKSLSKKAQRLFRKEVHSSGWKRGTS